MSMHQPSVDDAEIVRSDASSAAQLDFPRRNSGIFLFDVAPVRPTRLNPSRTNRSRRLQCYAVMLVVDLLCIFGGLALGSLMRFGDLHQHGWLRVSLAAVPLFIISALHNRSYSLETLRSPIASTCRVFAALASTFALLFVFSYFLKAEQEVSRLSIAAGVVSVFVASGSARSFISNRVNRWFAGEVTSTIIIRDRAFIENVPATTIVDASERGLRPDPRDPVMIQRLVQLVSGADRAVVVCQREVASAWATMLKCAHVCGEILADEVQSVGAVGVGQIGNRSTLVVSTGPLTLQQRLTKRLFDLAVAIPALIVFAPLLLSIAIAVKLDSPGPIVFRQLRVGFGNRFFTVYKFRTMAASATDADGTISTSRNDPRLTRLGRLLRLSSLDELPQLLNVLEGTMSLVGPRPHAVGSVAGDQLFWTIDERYAHRHLLKPGITGLAQVRGQRGATHRVGDLSRRLQSDLEYMRHWSIWTDVKIIGQTFGVLLHPNAY